MATARDLLSPNKLVDLTEPLLSIPNRFGLIGQLGIFREQSVSHNTVQFESKGGTITVVKDQYRGGKNQVNSAVGTKIHSYVLTHHPLSDSVTAAELVDQRRYGTADQAETVQQKVTEKLEDISASHDLTLELARIHTLVTGTQYAPNGTVSANFYTDFGVTRKDVNMTLGSTSGTIVREKTQEILDHMRKNILSGEVVRGGLAFVSPELFDDLVGQAGVVDAWKYAQMLPQINQNGFTGGTGYQEYTFNGIRFVRYDESVDGTPVIPAGEGIVIPNGTRSMFETYFGPAQRMGFINTAGERRYVWSKMNEDETEVGLTSESNFVNIIRRPAAVVRILAS